MADDGFIQQFSGMILDSIRTSPVWAESIATSLLGAAVGPNIVTKTRVGPLNLNTWYLIIGASSLAHKTTPLKYHARPMIEELESILGVDLTVPTRFSTEALVEFFAKRSSEGVIIRDEFSSAFKDMEKDYLTDFSEFLSEIYDCSVQKRYTRGKGMDYVRKVYVNLLAATTPFLYQILKYDFWQQGTGNRILYIVDSTREAVHEDPDNYFASANDVEVENEQKRRSLAMSLVTIRNSPLRVIQPDQDAGKLLVDFKYRIETQLSKRYAANPYDVYTSYMARLPEMSFKLTALSALSRWYNRLANWQSPDIISLSQDAEWAIKKVEYHFADFKKMVEAWRQRPEVFTAKTYDNQALQVIDYLDSRDTAVPWSQLRNDMRWTTEVWSQVLHLLFDTKKIFIAEHKPPGAGRPSIVFFSPVLYEKLHNDGSIVILEDWSLIQLKLRLK